MKNPIQPPFRTAHKFVLAAVHVWVWGSTLGCNGLLGNEREWEDPVDKASLDHGTTTSTFDSSVQSTVSSAAPNSTDTKSRTSASSREDRETSNTADDADTETSVGVSVDAGSTMGTTDDSAEPTSSNGTSSHASHASTNDESDGGTCPIAECATEEQVCVFGARQTCELDEHGCLKWSEPEDCASDLCADETTCLDCSLGGDGCPTCEGESCPVAVGQPCGEEDRCVGGRCQQTSDGTAICCAASCDSACQACAPSGQSCVEREDDARCGTVTCPPDNPCRNYTAEAVTADRCVDGTCGSADEVCPYVVRNDGEECSETHLCDTMGNCSVPKLALGAVCEEDSACTSDHCVDGVCCASECDGVCMQCRAGTGICDVTPVDDDDCSDVECSRWNADCTRALGNITADHCAGFGVCKSELSCPIENRPRGTPCAGHMLYVCDGEGECDFPTVACGQTTCLPEINGGGISGGCCHHHPDYDLSPLECRQRDECVEQFGDWSVECDEQADCRSGETVCCGIGVNGMGWVACSVPEDCNIFASPVGTAELCQSPAMGAVECSNGGACITVVESLPGFKFCTRTETSE